MLGLGICRGLGHDWGHRGPNPLGTPPNCEQQSRVRACKISGGGSPNPHEKAASDPFADVAQLVEHFTRNEGVPGSNPGVGSGAGRLLLLAPFEDFAEGLLYFGRQGEAEGCVEGLDRERAQAFDRLDDLGPALVGAARFVEGLP